MMPLTFNIAVTLDDATLAALRAGGDVIVPVPVPTPIPVPAPPPVPAPVPAPAPNSPGGWHGDFRFSGGTPDELNFNWLMDTRGANYAWNYLMARWAQLGQPLARDTAGWDDGERNRVVNTYGGQGSYGPADAKKVICSVKAPDTFRYDMGREIIVLPNAVPV